MIRVAILGSGPVGQALAALIGSRPELEVRWWGRSLEGDGPLRVTARGVRDIFAIGTATAVSTPREAVKGADIVVLAVPVHVQPSLLKLLASLIAESALILAWEGCGRFSETVRALRLERPVAIGLQRSPLICRKTHSQRVVEILGVRDRVVAATVDPGDAQAANQMLAALLPLRFVFAHDYTCVTLSPANPLIHPARLFSADWRRLRVGRGLKLYGDWDDVASATLLELHRELARVRDALGLPVRHLRTLTDGRRPMTTSRLTQSTVAVAELGDVQLPVHHGVHRIDWNLSHRFFEEDIGGGLGTILKTAESARVAMPTASAIHGWYLDLLASGRVVPGRRGGDAAHHSLR